MADPLDSVLLGARVVMRRRLTRDESADARGNPTLTDVLGELVARTPTAVTVRTSNGPVSIERSMIVAAKEIPARPTRRGAPHRTPTPAELAHIVGPSWAPLESEPLGDWQLRAGGGWTMRANSVLASGDPGMPLEAAIEIIEMWYAARQLPPRVMVTSSWDVEPDADPLAARLRDRGWNPGGHALSYTARTSAIASAVTANKVAPAQINESLDDNWLRAYSHSRKLTAASVSILTNSPRQLFGAVSIGDRCVAVGRLGIARGWAGLGAVWTDPAYRRQGIATSLTVGLARTASRDGIHLMHLQVEVDNANAIKLYERMGFEPHSRYLYLTAPP